jgi:hypothetical protein
MTSVFNYYNLQGQPIQLPVTLARTLEEGQVLATTFLESGVRVLGMDTETTLTNPSIKTSTIQLATSERIGIFQLNRIGSLPSALQKLLVSSTQIKVGVGLTGDVAHLRDWEVECQGWIDLQSVVTAAGIPAISMSALLQRFLPFAPSKDALGHRGNWDGDLTPAQIFYAASDAYASLLLYYAIMSNGTSPPIKPSVSVDDDGLLLNWIKLQLASAVSDRTLKSLVNQIVNSYGPWRNRYLLEERRDRAESTLKRLINQGALPFDSLRQVIPVTPKPASVDKIGWITQLDKF